MTPPEYTVTEVGLIVPPVVDGVPVIVADDVILTGAPFAKAADTEHADVMAPVV